MPDNDSRNNKNVFLQVLKDYNLLNNKHIPNEFKFNDRNVRLQTLAGILDTDGSYSQKDKCFDIIQEMEEILVHNFNHMLSDDDIFNLFKLLTSNTNANINNIISKPTKKLI